MGRGAATQGRLTMHELVGWEGVKWGHFGRPFHPTHEAWRDIALFPEVRERVDIVREAMRGLHKLWIAREAISRSSGNVTAKHKSATYLKRTFVLSRRCCF